MNWNNDWSFFLPMMFTLRLLISFYLAKHTHRHAHTHSCSHHDPHHLLGCTLSLHIILNRPGPAEVEWDRLDLIGNWVELIKLHDSSLCNQTTCRNQKHITRWNFSRECFTRLAREKQRISPSIEPVCRHTAWFFWYFMKQRLKTQEIFKLFKLFLLLQSDYEMSNE